MMREWRKWMGEGRLSGGEMKGGEGKKRERGEGKGRAEKKSVG